MISRSFAGRRRRKTILRCRTAPGSSLEQNAESSTLTSCNVETSSVCTIPCRSLTIVLSTPSVDLAAIVVVVTSCRQHDVVIVRVDSSDSRLLATEHHTRWPCMRSARSRSHQVSLQSETDTHTEAESILRTRWSVHTAAHTLLGTMHGPSDTAPSSLDVSTVAISPLRTERHTQSLTVNEQRSSRYMLTALYCGLLAAVLLFCFCAVMLWCRALVVHSLRP